MTMHPLAVRSITYYDPVVSVNCPTGCSLTLDGSDAINTVDFVIGTDLILP
jgi:hypothetical protein